MSGLLGTRSVSLSFGGLKAVQQFNLELRPGELQGLIGPNGAGKTTIFNLLTGVYRPQEGEIRLDGMLLNGMRPNQITGHGLARTFQNIRLFGNLSVLDNVRTACHLRTVSGLAATLFRSCRHVGEERAVTERATDLLEIFGLADRLHEAARNLPYGDQRRLEIARALATNPKVLLLDEPAAGMNPQEKAALKNLIRSLRQRFAVTVLLIEHDMGVVMDLCERITVLDYGKTIAVGSPEQVQKDSRVIEAYLGTPTELPADVKV